MAGPTAFSLHIVVAFPDPLSSPVRCLFPSSSFSSYQSLLLYRILASIVRRYCSIFTSLHHHLRLLLAPTTAAKPAPSGTYIVIANYILSLSLSLCAFSSQLLQEMRVLCTIIEHLLCFFFLEGLPSLQCLVLRISRICLLLTVSSVFLSFSPSRFVPRTYSLDSSYYALVLVLCF
jgi:hypothetical protein